MQFFSDEYLMHYGIKGMKWKKKKKPEDKTPAEYYNEARFEVEGYSQNHIDALREGGEFKPGERADRHRRDSEIARDFKRLLRTNERGKSADPTWKAYARKTMQSNVQRHTKAQRLADQRRNADLKEARKNAYKKNQKRIAKQQRKAKVNNALKRVKNKIFVDTSGSTKIGNHLYVEHH